MGEARFARLQQIVADAMDLAPERRESFVHSAAGDDTELAHEALELLGYDSIGAEFTQRVEDGIAALAAHASAGRTLPATIGPFEIHEEIGEGGMGLVYRAQQRGPLEREVAIKVILRGWNSERVVARFDAERRTLARMEHPNIARVFDAGTTDDGRPWFAMELVRGENFHSACDARCLSVRARLRLFLSVCRAVHHAHQRGVIHRDLKPSNILVAEHEGELVPKVIDFGIAKALTESVDDRVSATIEGQVIGTPAYMSPERLAGMDDVVDIRTDVYSLGVLLYESLCGELPFEPPRDEFRVRRRPRHPARAHG
jgi:eukaryotic-like serine/threonine-protein kinase